MADRRPLFAVVLAGGRGSRMGSAIPKPLIEIGGRPLIERVLDVVRLRADGTVISTNAPESFAHLGLPAIADEEPDFAGPLAGLVAAARWFAAREERPFHLLSVAGDTPFLPADLVARLADGAEDDAVAVAAQAGHVHPIVALWSSDIVCDLSIDPAAPRRDRSLRAIQEAHACRIVDFAADARAPGGDPFFNVNTPVDLALARRWVEITG
ncbi:molybdenum cofactor guanylyltransferase [Aureimonas pseudogalii]|uniref:Molybdenum cofactor guanylyltransferase n=1 Tax=Aureimonas pseudogalii TaxID=1744844 RepID=A0A7W6H4T7_9HYPH|nr:molybdenum cofactor guanylyltransferase [Aureimonas pseudogalii]MBB3998209.1 molybdopterin-guanine dinucleotide biosynthesis protein A [Aureimonas pseudogalii]